MSTRQETLDSSYLLVILAIYIITLSAFAKNLDAPYLHFDEAGQFFIAKGLNHDSQPLEQEKGLMHVIENNAHYNLDPGGFSIILHLWSKVSNSHIWIRLLPFTFFIGIVLSFIYLSYLWLKNLNIALLMGFIPFVAPMVLSLGIELRPYSMECLGTILGVVALEKLKNAISYRRLFLWGCIFSFFITSRYSEIVVVFVVSLHVLYIISISHLVVKKKMIATIIYSFPVVVALMYSYFYALVFQNRTIEPIKYLPYISSNTAILIAPLNFLFLCLLALLIILFFLRNKYLIIKKYEMLLFMTISVNVLFVILSFLGKHPWNPFEIRCISLFVVMLLCISAFLGELIKPLFESTKYVKYYFTVSAIIFALFIRYEHVLFVRGHQNNTYDNFVMTDISNHEHIYVESWESPSVRYLFEYGKLKNRKEGLYPYRFTFMKGIQHSYNDGNIAHDIFLKTQPRMNDLVQYDLLITPVLFKLGDNFKWTLINGTTNFYIRQLVY
jgi:hypothetical protein